MGVLDEVLTGTSGSRRDHPNEFIESLNEADAMTAPISRVFVSETLGKLDQATDCAPPRRLDRRYNSRYSRGCSQRGGREEGSMGGVAQSGYTTELKEGCERWSRGEMATSRRIKVQMTGLAAGKFWKRELGRV